MAAPPRIGCAPGGTAGNLTARHFQPSSSAGWSLPTGCNILVIVKARGARSGGQLASDSVELAGALHEVSNALTVVLGWLDVARSRSEDPALLEAIDVARSHARLGHRLARTAIGGSVVDEETERAALAVAQEAVLGVTPEARRRGVGVRLVNRCAREALIVDPSAVSQILLNLLLNAIAYTPERAAVTLSLEQPDTEQIVFAVTDDGPGVDPERADTILTAPESTRRGGTGIGLPHSRSLAEVCGGRLELTSAGPGARFELCWPATEERSGARHPNVSTSILGGTRVLVVEDDFAVRTLIELGLEARGATVVCATTVAELLALGGEPFGAALVDLSPIAEDPRAALDVVRRANPTGPIVVISGSPTGVPESVRDQVHAWVRKPFEMREVIDTLCTLMAP